MLQNAIIFHILWGSGSVMAMAVHYVEVATYMRSVGVVTGCADLATKVYTC